MDKPICGSSFLFLKKIISGKHVFAFIPARCKCWSCSVCRRIKAQVVKKFIQDKFKGKNLWLLSITFFHSGTPLEAWEKIGENCNRLLSYAHKNSGSFDYIRIIEPHADGNWPHIHILCTKAIATVSFVKLIEKWGFGWNFHCKPIPLESACSYLSKYLMKEWPIGDGDLYRQISKTRIVSASRVLGAIFTKESDWDCVSYDQPGLASMYYCNKVIDMLKSSGALNIISRPYCGGFIITSDLGLDFDLLFSHLDPGVWKSCTDFNFDYFPFGLQLALEI